MRHKEQTTELEWGRVDQYASFLWRPRVDRGQREDHAGLSNYDGWSLVPQHCVVV